MDLSKLVLIDFGEIHKNIMSDFQQYFDLSLVGNTQ